MNRECNEIIEDIFAEVESFWPPERFIVEGNYRSITLPILEVSVDNFEMQLEWTAVEMLNYMRTCSATADTEGRSQIKVETTIEFCEYS